MIESYKVSDENHRFYVNKRFTIISLYFPSMTLILSGFYFFLDKSHNYQLLKIVTCTLGLLLTLFLYNLEKRNWILNNICLDDCSDIGKKIFDYDNLHEKFKNSYKFQLPESSTLLDKLLNKFNIINTQHKTVSVLTILIIIYWIILLFI